MSLTEGSLSIWPQLHQEHHQPEEQHQPNSCQLFIWPPSNRLIILNLSSSTRLAHNNQAQGQAQGHTDMQVVKGQGHQHQQSRHHHLLQAHNHASVGSESSAQQRSSSASASHKIDFISGKKRAGTTFTSSYVHRNPHPHHSDQLSSLGEQHQGEFPSPPSPSPATSSASHSMSHALFSSSDFTTRSPPGRTPPSSEVETKNTTTTNNNKHFFQDNFQDVARKSRTSSSYVPKNIDERNLATTVEASQCSVKVSKKRKERVIQAVLTNRCQYNTKDVFLCMQVLSWETDVNHPN